MSGDTDPRMQRIHDCLTQALAPVSLELIDEGHLHVGHAGAKSGRGHYQLRIVSDAFEGKSAVARHQAVYKALGELMRSDIHALGIDAKAPSEIQA